MWPFTDLNRGSGDVCSQWQSRPSTMDPRTSGFDGLADIDKVPILSALADSVFVTDLTYPSLAFGQVANTLLTFDLGL